MVSRVAPESPSARLRITPRVDHRPPRRVANGRDRRHDLEDVSERELVAAIDSMARGDVEYVIIENGDEFRQTAGEALVHMQ